MSELTNAGFRPASTGREHRGQVLFRIYDDGWRVDVEQMQTYLADHLGPHGGRVKNKAVDLSVSPGSCFLDVSQW